MSYGFPEGFLHGLKLPMAWKFACSGPSCFINYRV